MKSTLPFFLAIFSLTLSHGQTITNLMDSGTGSLRHAVNISSAGDTIQFDPSVLSAGVNDTIFLTSEILIDKSLYLYGLDHDTAKVFVSGSDSTRLFKIDITNSFSNTLAFKNYYFTNAKAVTDNGNGGGLLIIHLDTLRLTNCEFLKCEALNSGGAIHSRSYNFTAKPKHTIIDGCKFSQNSAQGYSAGDMDFYRTGTVQIENCEFSETLKRGSKFEFCEGLYIYNSIIRNNGGPTASFESIGITAFQTDTFYANNLLAYNNKTDWSNPVIWINSSNGSLIENSIFYDNEAGKEAGVFLSAGDITLRNCQFYNNSAQWGGVTISEKTTFEQCIFRGNTADFHGGVISYSGRASPNSYTTFYGCDLDSNFSGSSGGAVSILHSNFRFERSSATRNQAGGEGGAFRLLGFTGSAFLFNSTIAENFASDEGGAITVSNVDSFKIRNCTFANNMSAANGDFINFSWTDSAEIEGSIIINHQNPISYYGKTKTKLISRGYNILEFDFPNTLGSDLTNIVSTYPILDSLQKGSGIGMILPPLSKSIAVNRGNPLDHSLPQNGAIIANVRDIGAAESQDSSIVNVQNLSICDSTYLHGEWVSTTGLYVDTNLTSSTLDSVSYVWINEVNSSITDTLAVQSCDSYTWINGQTYTTSSDTAKMMFHTLSGCDSSIILDLEIVEIDTALSVNNLLLEALDTTAQYQWMDCDQSYAALSNANQYQYTVTRNGSYGVILTKKGCSDTSTCVEINNFGITSFSQPITSVYPNPTGGTIQIRFETDASISSLNVYTSSGKLIYRRDVDIHRNIEVELDHPPGIYFIEAIDNNGNKFYHKVVKH